MVMLNIFIYSTSPQIFILFTLSIHYTHVFTSKVKNKCGSEEAIWSGSIVFSKKGINLGSAGQGLTWADPEWGQGVLTPPPPPPPPPWKNKNIGYLSNTDQDPLKNHKATKPAFKLFGYHRPALPPKCHLNGHSLGADESPLIVLFGSFLPSSTKKNVKGPPLTKLLWIPAWLIFLSILNVKFKQIQLLPEMCKMLQWNSVSCKLGHTYLIKQCKSRSACFWKSSLIYVYAER